jgi:membrane protease YdiL (CAAX protease family)
MLDERHGRTASSGSPTGTQLGRRSSVPAALSVPALIVAACLASYGWSRLTAWLGHDLPVGTLTLALAGILTARAPRRFGWRWGSTGRARPVVASSLGVVVAAVSVFRLVSPPAPYALTPAEVIVVPLGEEGLFRGFLLGILLAAFGRRLRPRRATSAAVAGSALAFGTAHLGNLGLAPTGFVVLQVCIAVAFGVLAGWVRVRTSSLAGPVLLHAVMNGLAVA